MICIQYQPELIEQAVWLAARRDAATEHALHHAVDPLFELPQDDERESRFRDAFVDWFTRLRLDRFLEEMLPHFPRIVEQVAEAVVRAAPRRKSEGAELFVRDEAGARRRTLVVQVCPESLSNPESIGDSMLREMQHAEDMLDETFGYVPESVEGLPSRQQVVRDRYSMLWNVRVEAALAGRGLLSRSDEARLRSRFERTFTVAGAPPPPEAFASVWSRPNVSHAQLLAWAKDPRAWLQPAGHAASSRALGEPCPTCGFPTFDWFNRTDVCDDDLVSQIRQSMPAWKPEDGICRQCAETYLSASVVGTA